MCKESPQDYKSLDVYHYNLGCRRTLPPRETEHFPPITFAIHSYCLYATPNHFFSPSLPANRSVFCHLSMCASQKGYYWSVNDNKGRCFNFFSFHRFLICLQLVQSMMISTAVISATCTQIDVTSQSNQVKSIELILPCTTHPKCPSRGFTICLTPLCLTRKFMTH